MLDNYYYDISHIIVVLRPTKSNIYQPCHVEIDNNDNNCGEPMEVDNGHLECDEPMEVDNDFLDYGEPMEIDHDDLIDVQASPWRR